MEIAGPNAAQIEYWNADVAHKWVALQEIIDAQIRPLGLLAMQRLGDLDGRRVLDVGCGCGETSLDLARRVGAGGSVHAVDISAPMLQCAIDSASREGLSNVSFERADAQTHAFESGVYDAVFSRFGVMFFADPRAAFANLRGALRPGGVLAFICWRGLENNEWMIVPLRAALEHLPAPEPPEPGAPGPFAYADPIRVRDFLEGAGYQDLTLEQLDQPMTVGAGLDLDQTVDFALQMGPTGRMLREVDPALRPVVAATVRKALEPFLTEDGVRMASSAWIVTARNPEK